MGHCRHKVIVGASPLTPNGKFIPIAGLTTADGEAWMYMNHRDTPIANHPEMVDGKIVHSAGDFKHEQYAFYDAGGDKLKWNMPFPNGVAVPKTIRFKITSENLIFTRQSEPTQAEIAELAAKGIIRKGFTCPEAKDSFAIHRADGKTGDIIYKDGTRINRGNGKVGHIYSTYFTDEAGARSPLIRMELTPNVDKARWLIFHIEDAQRPEVMAWALDPDRVGEITFDPLLGYELQGLSSAGLDPNFPAWSFNPQQASDNWTVAVLKVWSVVGKRCKLSLAEASGSGAHLSHGQDLAAEGAEIDPTTAGINSAIVTAKKDVVSGQWYRNILYMDNPLGFTIFFDAAPSITYERNFTDSYAVMPQDPGIFGLDASFAALVSIWAASEEVVTAQRSRSRQARPLGIKEGHKKGNNFPSALGIKGGFR